MRERLKIFHCRRKPLERDLVLGKVQSRERGQRRKVLRQRSEPQRDEIELGDLEPTHRVRELGDEAVALDIELLERGHPAELGVDHAEVAARGVDDAEALEATKRGRPRAEIDVRVHAKHLERAAVAKRLGQSFELVGRHEQLFESQEPPNAFGQRGDLVAGEIEGLQIAAAADRVGNALELVLRKINVHNAHGLGNVVRDRRNVVVGQNEALQRPRVQHGRGELFKLVRREVEVEKVRAARNGGMQRIQEKSVVR
eukprot:Amastigsp_a677397_114.p3 type:complete len:256 gc:universal Amastigsp_a677397_114:515-1282(+)